MDLDAPANSFYRAAEDFRRARRQAAMEDLSARLTGRSSDLLSFEVVRRKLKGVGGEPRGLKEIPLEAIVGSVGRHTDYTRSFLPRRHSDRERWARVEVAIEQGKFPPIEVYQIGSAYFVQDGNHRVSVARRLGATHIEAYVTEIPTRVALSPDVEPEDLILMAEYAEFLDRTHLDELRPEADLRLTVPGHYRTLEEHIEVHHYYMGLDEKRDVSWPEAVAHWYDTVYLPVIHSVRKLELLEDFPGHSEADLYLWISKHRVMLEAALGWEISAEAAAGDLAAQHGPAPDRVAARLGERIKGTLVPAELAAGPPPGQWRQERFGARHESYLFSDILVAISGTESGWCALEQGIELAKRENSRLLGLHVVPDEKQLESEEARAVREEFNLRCARAGTRGGLVLAVGDVFQAVTERARWSDLVIASLTYAPGAQPLARLRSGFRALVRRCPTPVLAVPGQISKLERALLAYDGSPRAEEALYVAAYLAGRWGMRLAVITVREAGQARATVVDRARAYLEAQGVEAAFLEEKGEIAAAIMKQAEQQGVDLIVMGGYGLDPVREVVLGSTVDHVLRARRWPVLICR
jgi:nucleotide-binding universal stress UspA family protein